MAISEKDIKLLWGRSGDRCAICGHRLSHKGTAALLPLGEQAHIVARSLDGPRGDSPLPLLERDTYSNLILLCPNDHARIDDFPEDYPVEKLLQIKEAHELWVQRTLSFRPRGPYHLDEGVYTASLFLHFLDHYYLEMKGTGSASWEIEEARLATRLALLAADHILIPASAYAESALCRTIIHELRTIFEQGCVWQVGAGAGFEEYLERKLDQYPSGSSHRAAYLALHADLAPPFLARELSATDYIVQSWRALLETDAPARMARKGTAAGRGLESCWESIPDLLGETAFIVDHVSPLLLGPGASRAQNSYLHAIINRSYYDSFIEELDCGLVQDLVYLRSPFEIRPRGRDISYRKLRRELARTGILAEIAGSPTDRLLQIRQDPRWHSAFFCILNETRSTTLDGGHHDRQEQ